MEFATRKRGRHGYSSVDSLNPIGLSSSFSAMNASEAVDTGLGLGLGLDVVGRHALLFDDDAAAAFVNSRDALVPLNCNPDLLIDRYDVRHLVSEQQLLALRRKTHSGLKQAEEEGDLDFERYRDLREADEEDSPSKFERHRSTGATYQYVPYSYGSEEKINGCRDTEGTESTVDATGYKPPFPLPDSLLCHLPPTEKSHQIMARTAKFVSEHGGQSEIVLRVKQGSNPVFGFLMPDHKLYSYYRYMVDHPELLDSCKESDNQPTGYAVPSESLSLLGSVYGTGDDEDEGPMQQSLNLNGNETSAQIGSAKDDTSTAKSSLDQAPESKEDCQKVSTHTSKDAAPVLSSSRYLRSTAPSSDEISTEIVQPAKASADHSCKDPMPILEPPHYLLCVIEKMVEFISRNGKEFEAIIVNQDRTAGRFPFLLPSNPYHPYYLKALEASQQGKPLEKRSDVDKSSVDLHSKEKENTRHLKSKSVDLHSKEKETTRQLKSKSSGSSSRFSSLSQDTLENRENGVLDKKKKLQLVFGSKKDARDNNIKPISLEAAALAVQEATKKRTGIQIASKGAGDVKNEDKEGGVSVDAAAAIVMAATRGLRKSSQGSKTESLSIQEGIREKLNLLHESIGNDRDGVSSTHEGNHYIGNNRVTFDHNVHDSRNSPSPNISAGSRSDSKVDYAKHAHDGTLKPAVPSVSVEEDSSKVPLSHEEKIKAERRKRAKLFAAMLKSKQKMSNGADDSGRIEMSVSAYEAKTTDHDSVSGNCVKDVVPVVSEDHISSLKANQANKERDTHKHEDEDEDHSGTLKTNHSHRHRDKHKHSNHKRRSSHHHKRSKAEQETKENEDDEHEHEHDHSSKKHRHDSAGSRKRRQEERDDRKRRSDGKEKHSNEDRDHQDKKHSSKSSNLKEDRGHKKRHHDSESKKSENGHHKRHKHGHRSRSREKDSRRRHEEESDIEESSPRNSKNITTVAQTGDAKEESSVKVASDSHDAPSSNVPDDLRAKIRAMLLANL